MVLERYSSTLLLTLCVGSSLGASWGLVGCSGAQQGTLYASVEASVSDSPSEARPDDDASGVVDAAREASASWGPIGPSGSDSGIRGGSEAGANGDSGGGSRSGGSPGIGGGSEAGANSDSGSGGGSGGSPGGGGTSDDAGCASIDPQFAAATCTQCATCLAPYCCAQINACYGDPGCAAELSCVLACYGGAAEGGAVAQGDVGACVASCTQVDVSVESAALYTAQDDCQNSGSGAVACNGTWAGAPCQCGP